MKLENLIPTLASQIPIVAIDVLAPEELTIIRHIQVETVARLEIPVFFWNLGTSGLNHVGISKHDGGLVFDTVDAYKKPPHADPLLHIFEYIQNLNESGLFILGDLHPFIGKNSQVLSWEVVTRIKNLYHLLKPTDKRIVLIGQGIGLHECLARLIPCCEVQLPGVEKILNHLEDYLPFLEEAVREQGVEWSSALNSSQTEELARASLGLTLEEISDFLRLHIKLQVEPKRLASKKSIAIAADIIPAVVEYKTRMLYGLGIELGKAATTPFGGLDLFRDWLLRRRRLFTEEARANNLPLPKGVLLAGPPGTGKSLLAKNVASILNLPLLKLDVASMLGSLVGESEGNIRRALKTAEAIKPCVLWLDEVDKALSGTADSSGVSQRILGTILTFMSESEGGVFVVATANDVTALPSEFKRRGRFDENFFVDLPTAAERASILNIHLARFGCSVPDEYIEAIANSTDKFSGSELENLAAEAAIRAFDAKRPQQINLADLETCRTTIIPLAIQDKSAVERMLEWAKLARPASSCELSKTSKNSLRTPKMRG